MIRHQPLIRGAITLLALSLGLLVLAAAASAQPLVFTANYNIKTTGRNGTPTCPDNEFVCGQGTSPQFGSFTYTGVFGAGDLNVVTLTFGDGTLVLDEIFDESLSSTPGNSGNAPTQGHAFGNPNTVGLDWTVDSLDSTGVFSGLSGGTGTDIFHFAGVAGQGMINGTLTPAS